MYVREYWDYREPYLSKFFVAAAGKMQLTGAHRLLDIACGRGAVAFGFAPYVGPMTGIDIDEQALADCRVEAQRNNIKIELIHGSIGDIPDDLAPIDLVTIGRAHAYLPREETLRRLEQLVSPSGRVLICGTTTSDRLSGPWAHAYRATRRLWAPKEPDPAPEAFMQGSAFDVETTVYLKRTRRVAVEHLVLRALAFRRSLSEAMTPKSDEYLEDIRSAISPYAVDGMLTEVIVTGGTIFRRAPS